jgi:23S rRNA (guanine2445-N2)-methyltransferase / 23S rRNA (guanine2069-N7)-methyltransferase
MRHSLIYPRIFKNSINLFYIFKIYANENFMTSFFFVTCPKGLEPLLFEELVSLKVKGCLQTVAGVFCTDRIESAYRVCLWSRLANRVLLQLGKFKVDDAEQLYKGVYKINWLEHMGHETTFKVDFSGTSHAIDNTLFGAQKTKDALVDHIRFKSKLRPIVDMNKPALRINVRLYQDEASVSLDLSGDSLHQRGYRPWGGTAPLKENLAAALLIRAGWKTIAENGGALVDPLCGSGTLLIEGLMMAANIAPGLLRTKWGFEGWRGHNPSIWDALKKEAAHARLQGLAKKLPLIQGSDQDAYTIDLAKENLRLAGLENCIQLSVAKAEALQNTTSSPTGLLICNPPYGERLENETPDEALEMLYQAIAIQAREHFQGWELAILTSNPTLCSRIGLRPRRKYQFYNGRLECKFFLYTILESNFLG